MYPDLNGELAIHQFIIHNRKIFGDRRVESNKPQEVAQFTNRILYQVMSEQNPEADDQVSNRSKLIRSKLSIDNSGECSVCISLMGVPEPPDCPGCRR